MGEYNEQTKRPHLYEQIAPEQRFAMLAGNILERTGESTTNDPNRVVTIASWPQKPNGYYYRLQRVRVQSLFGAPGNLYTLEHFIDGLPQNKPMSTYVLSTTLNDSLTTKINILDASGKEKQLDKEGRKEAIEHLLSVLTNAAPQEARTVLANAFHDRFNKLVGSYILSNLAIEGLDEEMNEYAAWAETEDFEENIRTIEEKVLERSRRKDSPTKQSFIEEAVSTRRSRTDKNEYRTIDFHKITEQVAREIRAQHGKQWKYTVAPDQ